MHSLIARMVPVDQQLFRLIPMSYLNSFRSVACSAFCLLGIGMSPALAVTVAVLLIVAGSNSHASLLTNGGFEEPAFVDDGSHYVKRDTGAVLTGWTTISIPGPNQGTVIFNTLYDAVSEGNQAIQIEDPSSLSDLT